MRAPSSNGRNIVGALLLVIAGCGSLAVDAADAGVRVAEPGRIPPEVAEVLKLRCQPCHSDPPQRYAPMPIVTWEQLQGPSPSDAELSVFEMVELRVGSEDFPMPPKESPELEAITDLERELLLQWVAQGAPTHVPDR